MAKPLLRKDPGGRKRTSRPQRSPSCTTMLKIVVLCLIVTLSRAADVESPVAAVTMAPLPPPTPPPTPPPSAPPTPEPTAPPTDPPTPPPTPPPSPPPSPEPTPGPTDPPTLAPSIVASSAPSPGPTGQPSIGITLMPSVSPSNPIPSATPSSLPSALPSIVPSIPPSRGPSIAPSMVPTTFPSISPTLTEQDYEVEVTMYFDNADPFGGRTVITYQDVTETQIAEEFTNTQGLNSPIMELRIDVDVQSQSETAPTSSTRRYLRRRVQAQNPLRLIFKTFVFFRSLSDDVDVDAIIGGAFNSDEDRVTFINRLRATRDSSFSQITDVRVEINGVEQVQPESSGGGGVNLFIIIGATAGGVALAILSFLFYCRKRPIKQATIATGDASGDQGLERLNTDILVEPHHQDDISTLGDPMYHPGGMNMLAAMEKDEVTASIVSGDYDYAKKYGAKVALQPSPSMEDSQKESTADVSNYTGLCKMDNSIFSDDSSFEQQFVKMEDRFEVVAPAGKLGMVIDTPSGGVPIVHAIKETSVLVDKVEVGDRLLSVDDCDTTGLTAMQVSKLISQKADNPSRTLMFARTRARAVSTDAPQ